MVFQKPNPFPAMTICRQRALRAQVLADRRREPRRPGRGDADQGRPVERGQGPARRARRRPLGRSAAAAVHRPGPGRAAPSPAHGRAVLGARPDLHAPDRADHQGDRRRGDGRHRDPQHAAGPAGLRLLRLLPGRGEPAGTGRGVRPTPRRCSATPPTRGRSTMSTATSAERARRAGPSPGARRRRPPASWPSLALLWGDGRRPWASPSMQSTGSSFAGVAIQQWVGQTSTLYGLNINWQVHVLGRRPQRLRPEPGRLRGLGHPLQLAAGHSHADLPYQYMPDVAGGLRSCTTSTATTASGSTTSCSNASVDRQDLPRARSPPGTTRPSPQINPQLQGDLPNTKIVPVYRTDASGENYLLSDYLLHQDGPNFTAAQHAFQAGGILGVRPTERHLAHPDARRHLTTRRPTRAGRPAIRWAERLGQRRQLRVVRCRARARSPTWRPPTPRSTTSRWPRC